MNLGQALAAIARLGLLWMLLFPIVAAAAEEPRPALITLTVNDVDQGVVKALVRGKDFLLPLESLRKAGLAAIAKHQEVIAGSTYVNVVSLAPKVSYSYDDANLVLHLTAEPTLLPALSIDVGRARPNDITYLSSPSAFVNYAVTMEDANSFSAFSEQGANFGSWGPADSIFFDNILSRDSFGQFSRSTTNLTFDNRADLIRLQLGDTLASGGTLGGLAPLGGIGFSKEFTIDPYFTPFPGQRFSGVVNTPSTADIYVNGVLVRSISLPPGPFNLQNIPILNGSGDTRVVIRNAFGQQQVLTAPYYLAAQALAEGVQQFNYELGFERNMTTNSVIGDYGRPDSWRSIAMAGTTTSRQALSSKATSGCNRAARS